MPGPVRMPSDNDDGALAPPPRLPSEEIIMPPPPSNARQTTTLAGDLEAKHRASNRHERRSRPSRLEPELAPIAQHKQKAPVRVSGSDGLAPLPGPVRVPGSGGVAPVPSQPGPVRVVGSTGASTAVTSKTNDSKKEDSVRSGAASAVTSKSQDSKVSSKKDDSGRDQLLTAILVNDDDEGLDDLEKQRIEEKAKKDVQNKIFAQAVEAQAADLEGEEEERKLKQRRRLCLCLLLLFLLILAGGGGIAVALSLSSEPPSEAPTLSPTVTPTVMPPLFVPPALNSSLVGDDAVVIEILDNTVCEGAFDISTTIGEPFFGSISDQATVAPVDTCEVIFRNGVGVWYHLVGDGSRYGASTCNGTSFDTQISIFSGACRKLQCVAGNDQMRSCGNGDQSFAAFATEPGMDYYIYVQARREAQRLFKMLVEPLNSNDQCEGAVTLLPNGPSVFDSTRGATIDNVECFGIVPESPGVWYTVQGIETGEYVNRFRQIVDSSGTAFVGRFMVFEGDDCGSLTCVDTRFDWDVVDGVTYYVLVYGGDKDQQGDFRVAVEIDEGFAAGIFRPPQDCFWPILLFPGASATGNTEFRSLPEFGSCGNLVFANAGSAWYDVFGTGGPLTVSTCNTTESFDTQISVLQGLCDDLVCIDGNDQACGDHSSVSWFSEAGVVYHIAVHGYAMRSGSFTITLEETDITASETCESALSIDADGVSTLGTTEGLIGRNIPNCSLTQGAGPGVWYRVLGSGRSLTVSTCLTSTNIETQITVLSGGCNNLGCVPVDESPCGRRQSTTWFADAMVEYLVSVQAQKGFGEGSPFILYAEATPTNDRCGDAVGPLATDGSFTFGSTRSATTNPLVSVRSRGVWYLVSGTGTLLTASTCSEYTDFPAFIWIFEIDENGGDSSCDNLIPVETRSAFPCGERFGSSQNWTSVQDSDYYLLVAGDGAEDFGNFALSIDGP